MNGNNYRKLNNFNSNGNNSSRRTNSTSSSQKAKSNGTFNGFNANKNKYAANSKNNYNSIENSLERARQNGKKAMARQAIRTGLNSVVPGSGEVADKVLKTEKGEELLDAYAQGENNTKGLINVANKLNEQQKNKKMVIVFFSIFGPILFVVLLLLLLFKNADTQIYSNQNNGQVDTGEYPDNDVINPNVFVKYPGLYEKVEAATKKISDKYKIEIDKYLILATLIAPIENGNIMPVYDGSCGEDECYYLDEKSYTWKEFLELWGDQSEYLAKSQILTYVNETSDIKVDCGSEDTMEQYAKNDMEVNEFNFWALFNPVNWFKGFRSVAEAETNAKCIMDVPSGDSDIPTVRVLSKEQGIYYNTVNINHERDYVKDPNSGGVYFWNLVNEGGFIHVYMKDYLNVNPDASDEQNYEDNLSTILDIGNYIYSYYESIRKDCNGFNVIESTIETINVTPKGGGAAETIDFENQYLGGVLLAEYNSGNLESLKAFAILARSYAISVVGVDGSGTIENSSNNQNYNPNYSPEKYPKIAEAVESTRGLVVTNYGQTKVKMTEYDAFCPVKNVLDDDFYYLPDGQNNLPINPDAYEEKTGLAFNISERYLECPCFQNSDSRPYDEKIDGKHIRFHTSPNSPPTHAGGTPSQTTLESCWTATDHTRAGVLGTEYGWAYKPSGGHGRGASQYGLKYYGAFEYEWEALIKLFYGDNIAIRRLQSSLEDGQCQGATLYEGGAVAMANSCGVTYEVSDSNYTSSVSGNPLNKPLTEALTNSNYSIECLNGCINARVSAAGSGTREGVVEAGIGLLECTMEMTGGFTYPYDHRGGAISYMSSSIGVNELWGEYTDYATGCGSSRCRLGLNCANFVRWSMCNGGMSDLCNRGSTFATAMSGVNTDAPDYFPGAIRIYFRGNSFSASPNLTVGELSQNYQQKLSTPNSSSKLSSFSVDKIISLIQPGDVLYSDKNGGSNHVMLVTGVEDSAIWIAENGRKTRKITHSALKSNSMTYVVLLLDGFYEGNNV